MTLITELGMPSIDRIIDDRPAERRCMTMEHWAKINKCQLYHTPNANRTTIVNVESSTPLSIFLRDLITQLNLTPNLDQALNTIGCFKHED